MYITALSSENPFITYNIVSNSNDFFGLYAIIYLFHSLC